MGKISDYAKICKDTHITDENLTDYFIVDTIHHLETEFDAREASRLSFNQTISL